MKHTGAYCHLGNAWTAEIMHSRGTEFVADKTVSMFEIYKNDPEETLESKLVTCVHLPAK